MKLLGILRASALFILLSAFHGQPVSCGLFKSNKKSKKDSNAKVSEISENLKDSTVESPLVEKPSQEPSSKSSVPVAKSNLVFENSKWDDSMLASTFVFINEFCGLVNAENFGGKVSEGLSKACVNLSSNLDSLTQHFTPTYGPGSVGERKEIPMDLYKDVLKAEDFKLYAKWLVKNTFKIRDSLIGMYYESLDLTEEQLNEFSSYGPLRYGFVYTGKPWGELSHGVSRGFFKDSDISKSFKGLKSSLDKILKSFPKDSTVKSQAA